MTTQVVLVREHAKALVTHMTLVLVNSFHVTPQTTAIIKTPATRRNGAGVNPLHRTRTVQRLMTVSKKKTTAEHTQIS